MTGIGPPRGCGIRGTACRTVMRPADDAAAHNVATRRRDQRPGPALTDGCYDNGGPAECVNTQPVLTTTPDKTRSRS